jgi:hypothetical protein
LTLPQLLLPTLMVPFSLLLPVTTPTLMVQMRSLVLALALLLPWLPFALAVRAMMVVALMVSTVLNMTLQLETLPLETRH